MNLNFCIPVIPCASLEKSLRLWMDGLGFEIENEMRADGKLIFCMLRQGDLHFMLNRRARITAKPKTYEGIRLYWTPSNLQQARDRLSQLGYKVSEISERDYGQTEFFLTDDDGYSHCFGMPTTDTSKTTLP